jgi:hypothetical protein
VPQTPLPAYYRQEKLAQEARHQTTREDYKISSNIANRDFTKFFLWQATNWKKATTTPPYANTQK